MIRRSEAAVIGVPSSSGAGEEEVKAFVVLKSGENLVPAELIEFLSQGLADFKVPRYVDYRADLPKNAMGWVLKDALKQERPELAENCYDREGKA